MLDNYTFDKNAEFHGAKGLIFIKDKIVLFRRDDKTKNFPLMVDLPGGDREDGESPFETFKREIKEEFGIDVSKEDIVFSKKYPSVIDPSKESYFMVTKPLSVTEEDVVFGDEGLEFLLMTPEEFINLPDGVKGQQERVADYLKTHENI